MRSALPLPRRTPPCAMRGFREHGREMPGSTTRLSLLPLALAATVACSRGATGAPDLVTEPFEPKPVTIALDRLPEPNANESVRKVPQLVPPPTPPVLRAPAGFHVSRYW